MIQGRRRPSSVCFVLLLLGVVTPSARSQNTAAMPITITAAISEDSSVVGEELHFSGTFFNPTAESIKDIKVAHVPAGYFLERVCALPSAAPCPHTHGTEIASEVQAGSALAFWGTLRPDATHARRRISLVIEYSFTKTKSAVAVPLGFNSVMTRSRAFWSKAYAVLKDWALPIVVALFGVLLKLVTDKREAKRLEQDRVKALRAETWKQMLPETHRLTTKYYMPMAYAAERVSLYCNRYAAGTSDQEKTESARRAYYGMLLLNRRIQEASETVGGLYFKNRTGEKIAITCVVKIREIYPGTEEQSLRTHDQAVQLIQFNERLDSFMQKLDNPAEPANAPVIADWTSFREFLCQAEAVKRVRTLCQIFEAVVTYESNRPYEYWYGVPDKMELADGLAGTILNLFSSDNDKNAAEAYLSAATTTQVLESE